MSQPGEEPPTAEERLAGLLSDLAELRAYLDERGQHAYELAQRFLANAARDASSRARALAKPIRLAFDAA